MFTEDYLKYGKFSPPYCSKKCQEQHLQALSKSKFVVLGSLKNHESALVVHGADTTKRLKETEVVIITGNLTEQRARLVYEKILSMKIRNKKRFLTSREVQTFLLTELPADLKPSEHKIDVTAWVVMNKCKELFSLQVSFSLIGKRTRCLESI